MTFKFKHTLAVILAVVTGNGAARNSYGSSDSAV